MIQNVVDHGSQNHHPKDDQQYFTQRENGDKPGKPKYLQNSMTRVTPSLHRSNQQKS